MEEKSFEKISQQMQNCWHEMEKLSGLHLTLHDHSGMIKLDQVNNLLPGINFHRSECCQVKFADRKNCLAHCAFLAQKRAAEEKKSFTMTCWRGVKELVMPLYVNGRHAGTIFAGAFRDENFDISSSPPSYRKLYQSLPLWESSRTGEFENIMSMAGYAMFQLAANLQSSLEYRSERQKAIKDFFHYRFHEKVGAGDLAAALRLSESRTLHLLRELFGKGFSQLLNEERISRVESYLEQTDFPLHEIARLTGFHDEYYLSTVFKKHKQISPGTFRKKKKADSPLKGSAGTQ